MLQSSPAISNMHISNLSSSTRDLMTVVTQTVIRKNLEKFLKSCLTTLRRIFSLKFKSRMPMFCQKLWTNCSKSSNSFKRFIHWGNFNAVTCFFPLDYWQITHLLKSKYVFFSYSNNSSSSIASFIYYFFNF